MATTESVELLPDKHPDESRTPEGIVVIEVLGGNSGTLEPNSVADSSDGVQDNTVMTLKSEKVDVICSTDIKVRGKTGQIFPDTVSNQTGQTGIGGNETDPVVQDNFKERQTARDKNEANKNDSNDLTCVTNIKVVEVTEAMEFENYPQVVSTGDPVPNDIASENETLKKIEEPLNADEPGIPLEDMQIVDEVKEEEMVTEKKDNKDNENMAVKKNAKRRKRNSVKKNAKRNVIVYPVSKDDLSTNDFEKIFTSASSFVFFSLGDRGIQKKGAVLIKLSHPKHWTTVESLVQKTTCKDGTKPMLSKAWSPTGPQEQLRKTLEEMAKLPSVGDEETVSVFVNNIPPNTHQEMLRFLYPSARSIQLPVGTESSIQGYAIVEFSSLEEARSVVRKNKQYRCQIGENYLKLHVIGHEETKAPTKPGTIVENPAKQQRQSGKKNELDEDATAAKSPQVSTSKVSPLNRNQNVKPGEKRKQPSILPPAKKMKNENLPKQSPQSGNKQQNESQKNVQAGKGNRSENVKLTPQEMIKKNKNQRKRERTKLKKALEKGLKGDQPGQSVTDKGQNSRPASVQSKVAGKNQVTNAKQTTRRGNRSNPSKTNQAYSSRVDAAKGDIRSQQFSNLSRSRNSGFGKAQQMRNRLGTQPSGINQANRSGRRTTSSWSKNSRNQNVGFSSRNQSSRPAYNRVSPNFSRNAHNTARPIRSLSTATPSHRDSQALSIQQPFGMTGSSYNIGQDNFSSTGNYTSAYGSYSAGTPRSYNYNAPRSFNSGTPGYFSTQTADSYSTETQGAYNYANDKSYSTGSYVPYNTETDGSYNSGYYNTQTAGSYSTVPPAIAYNTAKVADPMKSGSTEPSFDTVSPSAYSIGTVGPSYNYESQWSSYETGTANDPYNTGYTGPYKPESSEIPYKTGSSSTVGNNTSEYDRTQTGTYDPTSDSYDTEANYIPFDGKQSSTTGWNPNSSSSQNPEHMDQSFNATSTPQAFNQPQAYPKTSPHSVSQSNYYTGDTSFKKPVGHSGALKSPNTLGRPSDLPPPNPKLNQALQAVASGTADAGQLHKLIQQLNQYEKKLIGEDKNGPNYTRRQAQNKSENNATFFDKTSQVKMSFCPITKPGEIKTFVNNQLAKLGLNHHEACPVLWVRQDRPAWRDSAVILQFQNMEQAENAVRHLHGTLCQGAVISLRMLLDSQRPPMGTTSPGTAGRVSALPGHNKGMANNRGMSNQRPCNKVELLECPVEKTFARIMLFFKEEMINFGICSEKHNPIQSIQPFGDRLIVEFVSHKQARKVVDQLNGRYYGHRQLRLQMFHD